MYPQFYAKKLAMCTKELIYIPYFETEEINPSDMRAYVSMDSYVTMPGVVYSDKVIVQSEGIKALYVKNYLNILVKRQGIYGTLKLLEMESIILRWKIPIQSMMIYRRNGRVI